MNMRSISVIALSSRDFDSFADKLKEACRWVSLAAKMGAQVAVLPETMNSWQGDGPGNPKAMLPDEYAFDDWQTSCEPLLDCAVENGIAVTVPAYVRENGALYNRSYLIGKSGSILGHYTKTYPTDGELEQGVKPAQGNTLIDWDGIMVGGGICFDMNFPTLFADQVAAGAQLFLCPSLFPGGDQVNHYASRLQTPFAIAYPAWSRIVDMMGRDMVAGGYRHEQLRWGWGVPVYVADVNFDQASFHFDRNQEQIESILRKHGDKVAIDFDQQNCRFTIESRSDRISVQDVVGEFGLNPLRPALGFEGRKKGD
jgi:predicted amidohydrolase